MTSVIEVARPAAPERAVVTDADVLERAADLLGEYEWLRLNYGGRRAGGFCMTSAVSTAARDLGYAGAPILLCHGYLRDFLGGALPTSWNDAKGRTKAEVVGALRGAAANLREAQA